KPRRSNTSSCSRITGCCSTTSCSAGSSCSPSGCSQRRCRRPTPSTRRARRVYPLPSERSAQASSLERRRALLQGRKDQRDDAPADDAAEHGNEEQPARREHDFEEAARGLQRLRIHAGARFHLAHRGLEQRGKPLAARGGQIDRIHRRRDDHRDQARDERDDEPLPKRHVAAGPSAKAAQRRDAQHDGDDEADETEPGCAGQPRRLDEQAVADLERGEYQREFPYRRPDRNGAAAELLCIGVSHWSFFHVSGLSPQSNSYRRRDYRAALRGIAFGVPPGGPACPRPRTPRAAAPPAIIVVAVGAASDEDGAGRPGTGSGCNERMTMELDIEIEARGASYRLGGTYAPEFRRVVDAFIENFEVEEEVGAACSIVLEGRTVVDVWGGWRDAAMTVPWDAPTTVCMMSVAKGITAICFNMLIDRGLVDPDAYVTEYWPECGRNGKEKTRVRHILDHTAAVPVLTTNPLWPGAMFDREAIVKALEEQEPLWEIGTKAAYHVHH